MDYEKLLRAYIDHVAANEGEDFLSPGFISDLADDLAQEEISRLVAIGNEQRARFKKAMDETMARIKERHP